MPNLGPGVPLNYNPAVTPTQVYTPTPNAAATCRIINNGGSTVWVGGANVSKFNGLPLAPGNRPIELQNCPTAVYAAADVSASGAAAVTNAALAAGVTTFTVTTTGLAAGPAILGNAGAQEVINIASVASSTVLTLSNATLQDHVTAATVATAVARVSNVTVFAGVV
jgi:hypothetical protein